MKVEGDTIFINGNDGFYTELTGTIVNGAETDGTRMEVAASCTSTSFIDPFTYITIEQEITTMRVPMELDYVMCGIEGTLQVNVEQTQRSTGSDCNSTSCGVTGGCNATTGCKETR